MNNLECIFSEVDDEKSFAAGYLNYLSGLLNALDVESIAQFIEELKDARKEHRTVFFIGNGGSAATASHMANDFALGSRQDKDEPNPFRALALTDNTAKMTAISNDHGYDRIFVQQLRIHYRRGDKLVAISASGNSPNVVAACEWVRRNGGRTIGLVGFDGGRLKDICDLVIHAKTPKGEYGPVEDIHVILGHLIYTWFWYKERNK